MYECWMLLYINSNHLNSKWMNSKSVVCWLVCFCLLLNSFRQLVSGLRYWTSITPYNLLWGRFIFSYSAICFETNKNMSWEPNETAEMRYRGCYRRSLQRRRWLYSVGEGDVAVSCFFCFWIVKKKDAKWLLLRLKSMEPGETVRVNAAAGGES